MAGYLGQAQPVAAGGNSVESGDIVDNAITETKVADNAITDNKINSATLDQAVIDIDDNELLALAGL